MPRHEDRTRIAVAGSKHGSWVGQGGRAAIAVSVVGLALLFAAPIAMADSGASGGQAAATDTTTTADPQGQTSGTPGGAQPSGSTSSQLVSGSGASSSPSQTSGSSSSSGQGTVAGTSTAAASSSAPAASPSQTSDSSSSSGQGTLGGTSTPVASSTPPAASPSQTVSAATVPNTSSGATQSAAANATGSQSGAQNNSTTVRTGQGGNDGTVSQGNSDAATAASTAAGGTAPAGAASTSNATATATQTAPNNTSVDVRVGSPGNVGGANQSNGVQAAAGATANPPSGNTGGSGAANAQSTQTSPSNVSVVVRVASPGDNGAVTQQNSTGATAGANAPTPVSAGDVKPGPAGATNQTVPTTGEADGLNASTTGQLIDQRQGGDPPNAQASPTLSSGTGNPSAVGTATATQTGASNTSVSVRVGSPGKDGPVTQTNGATASGTSPQLSVVKTHCGTNTDVSVVMPGLIGVGLAVAARSSTGLATCAELLHFSFPRFRLLPCPETVEVALLAEPASGLASSSPTTHRVRPVERPSRAGPGNGTSSPGTFSPGTFSPGTFSPPHRPGLLGPSVDLSHPWSPLRIVVLAMLAGANALLLVMRRRLGRLLGG